MPVLVDEAVVSRARQLVRCASQRRQFLHQVKLDQKEQELSEAERWKEVFIKTDADGNGLLSQSEIRRLFRKTLRLSERTIPESTLQMIFQHVDVNGDNNISFTEFYDFLSQGNPNDIAAQEKSLEKTLRTIGRSMLLAWRRNHLQNMSDVERFLEKQNLQEDTKLTYVMFQKIFRDMLRLTAHEVSDHNIRLLFKTLDNSGERLLSLEELTYYISVYANPAEGDNFGFKPTGSESLRVPRTRNQSSSKRRHAQSTGSLPFSLKGREVPDRSRMSLNDVNAHLCNVEKPSHALLGDVDRNTSCTAKRLSVGAGLAATRPRTAAGPRASVVAGARMSVSAGAGGAGDRPVSAPSACKRPSNVSQASYASLPSASLASASRGCGSRRTGDDARPQSAPGGLHSGTRTPGNYRVVPGAETLNRIEQRMYEAGVDVRGQLHRLQSSPQLGR